MKRRYLIVSASIGKKPIVAPYSGAMLRDRRAIGERQRRQSGAIKLDELSDDVLLAQQLGDREHQISRGCARRQLAVQLEADDLAESASIPAVPASRLPPRFRRRPSQARRGR